MAINRRNGWVVVQAVLSEAEYKNEFAPKLKKSGLSESSYLRERLELPVKQDKKGKNRKGKRRPATQPKETPHGVAALPFVGHKTERREPSADEREEHYEEIIDESDIPDAQDERSEYGLDLLEI